MWCSLRGARWDLFLDGYAQGALSASAAATCSPTAALLSRVRSGAVSLPVSESGAGTPGLYRVDAGPRISVSVRSNVNVHLDWRQRLAGTAEPDSGGNIGGPNSSRRKQPLRLASSRLCR